MNRLADHRRIGRELNIFATEEECGSGLPFWLPAGATIRRELENFIIDLERRNGYQHVNTPVMAKRDLYARSGHWEHFHEEMYPPMALGSEQLVLRPMLCPHHILLYSRQPRNWRELPLRVAEVGAMFRYERSGVIGGLSRVREMTLNDGHVFCSAEHVVDEIKTILVMVQDAYRALHIPPPRLRLSRSGKGPKYASHPALWQQSEAMLRQALQSAELPFFEAEGEAAFYGPKIDLQVSDPHGREETLSTIQLDLLLPERFALRYEHDGHRHCPVIIHRSIISTMERMVAHLLEVHNGALPPWLSPTQVIVLPANSDADAYAAKVKDQLGGHGLRDGLRVELDDRDATLGARVRAAQQRKIPYLAVVGQREDHSQTISVRLRDGHQLAPVPVEEFKNSARRVIDARDNRLLER